eukprot:353072-Chlamydomonas_euryale.AAC.11
MSAPWNPDSGSGFESGFQAVALPSLTRTAGLSSRPRDGPPAGVTFPAARWTACRRLVRPRSIAVGRIARVQMALALRWLLTRAALLRSVREAVEWRGGFAQATRHSAAGVHPPVEGDDQPLSCGPYLATAAQARRRANGPRRPARLMMRCKRCAPSSCLAPEPGRRDGGFVGGAPRQRFRPSLPRRCRRSIPHLPPPSLSASFLVTSRHLRPPCPCWEI